jgi:hypothetical protein
VFGQKPGGGLEAAGDRSDRLGDGQEPLASPARAHHLEAERNPLPSVSAGMTTIGQPLA